MLRQRQNAFKQALNIKGKNQLKPAVGFSLVEIMVVMVIIAAMVGIASFTLGGGIGIQEVRREGDRLRAVIQQAQDDALLTGQDMGLLISEQSYQVLVRRFDGKEYWEPATSAIFSEKKVEPGILLELETEGKIKPLPTFIAEGAELTAIQAKLDEQLKSTGKDSKDKAKDQQRQLAAQRRELAKKLDLKPSVYILSSGEVEPAFEIFVRAESMPDTHVRVITNGIKVALKIPGLNDEEE